MTNNNELANAMDYLANQAKREAGTELQDISTLSACIKLITETENANEVCFKTIEAFLKNSPVLKSADYLEDFFDFDFEATDPQFNVDYTGGYTYVPDRLLSEPLVAERKQTHLLTQYYSENLCAKTIIRPRLKILAAPGLKICATELKNIKLIDSILPGSQFTGCKFETVNLYGANLHNSIFVDCHFSGVNFNDAFLAGAKFENCTFLAGSLSDAKTDKVTLSNCRFENVKMTSTDFGSTDFSSCDFNQCWLSNTDMQEIKGVTQQQIALFYGDASVALPEHLQRPSFWPNRSDISTWTRWIDSGEIVESTACITYE